MAGRVKRYFRNLFWDLAVLTEWWPWLSSWFDTWSIMCDEETMQAIRNVEKWIAEGTLDQHTVPLSEVLEKAGWTQEDVDAIPDLDEVVNEANTRPLDPRRAIFPPCPKAHIDNTGKEVV